MNVTGSDVVRATVPNWRCRSYIRCRYCSRTIRPTWVVLAIMVVSAFEIAGARRVWSHEATKRIRHAPAPFPKADRVCRDVDPKP